MLITLYIRDRQSTAIILIYGRGSGDNFLLRWDIYLVALDSLTLHLAEYTIIDGEDIGWLGCYIGQNTKLRELHFYGNTIDAKLFLQRVEQEQLNQWSSMVARLLDAI